MEDTEGTPETGLAAAAVEVDRTAAADFDTADETDSPLAVALLELTAKVDAVDAVAAAVDAAEDTAADDAVVGAAVDSTEDGLAVVDSAEDGLADVEAAVVAADDGLGVELSPQASAAAATSVP